MAKKVIIVDDDRDTREMLTLALSLEGYDVAEAANGLRLISSLHVDRPDLVILDVMMTWIDGFELCRSIKKNEQFKAIPVLFLSARKGGDDLRRGLAAGACEYFTKPVQVDQLLERVRTLIGPADEALEAAPGAAAQAPTQAPANGAPEATEEAGAEATSAVSSPARSDAPDPGAEGGAVSASASPATSARARA